LSRTNLASWSLSEFVRHILAVPKSELDARLDEEKKRKQARARRPPPAIDSR
jgi:hypothetical protein